MNPYYEDSNSIIYCGDCRNVIPCLIDSKVKINHIITDPPYDKKTHEGARYSFYDDKSRISFDHVEPGWIVKLFLRSCDGWILCFCSLEMLGDYKRYSGDSWIRSGFWYKPNGAPQFTGDRPAQPGEGLAIMHNPGKKKWNGGGKKGFWEVPGEKDIIHPTKKPLLLMKMLISDFTDENDIILDPFMGSGTTLRAAKDLKRKCIGIEINERYCEIAVKSLRQEVLL